MPLREEHPGLGASDRNPEEVREIPEVGHGELAVKQLRDVLKKAGCRRSEDDVVDVQQEVGEVISMAKYEEGHIRLGRDEAETMSVVGEALIPRSRSLLEAVERLVEAANMLGMSRVGEAGRLLAVHLLVKIAVKKGVLDVQLMNRPCARGGDAEDDADGRGLDDGAEGLIKVHTVLLREAAHNPSRLVP